MLTIQPRISINTIREHH